MDKTTKEKIEGIVFFLYMLIFFVCGGWLTIQGLASLDKIHTDVDHFRLEEGWLTDVDTISHIIAIDNPRYSSDGVVNAMLALFSLETDEKLWYNLNPIQWRRCMKAISSCDSNYVKVWSRRTIEFKRPRSILHHTVYDTKKLTINDNIVVRYIWWLDTDTLRVVVCLGMGIYAIVGAIRIIKKRRKTVTEKQQG